mgnify:CR=1 FL=1|jgi:hypothetical protein
MNKITALLSALAVSTAFIASASFAQTPAAPAAPAAAPTASAPAAAKAEKTAKTENAKRGFAPRTAKSKECSAKADEQKLHGKARAKFRAECKKAA